MENIYNPEGSTLRKHQLRMLEILKIVDAICVKHNIPYWLSSGTLLGAVRHGGFIPWDDDLDIELLRKDYRKLINILKEELPSGYVVQTNKTDKNYVAPYAKVRDTNSIIKENCKRDLNYGFRGIYIDIFYIERNPFLFAKITGKLHYFLLVFNDFKNDRIGIKVIVQNFILILLNVFYSFLRIFVGLLPYCQYRQTFGAGFCKPRNINDILPLKKIQFEGRLFNSPHNYDKYLRNLYGDYMKIPCVEELKYHVNNVEFKCVENEVYCNRDK